MILLKALEKWGNDEKIPLMVILGQNKYNKLDVGIYEWLVGRLGIYINQFLFRELKFYHMQIYRKSEIWLTLEGTQILWNVFQESK